MSQAREAVPDWLPRRLITVSDYHRMAETGILSPEDRVELIEGQIIEMPPIGSEHAGRVNSLNRTLIVALGNRAILSVQNPVRLSDILEPQPDFAVLKPRPDDYAGNTPTAEDVLLLIEVADTSLNYDKGVKTRLYARHGVPEFWIVDVRDRTVTVHRDPLDAAYTSVMRASPHDTLTIAALPGIGVRAGDLFPG